VNGHAHTQQMSRLKSDRNYTTVDALLARNLKQHQSIFIIRRYICSSTKRAKATVIQVHFLLNFHAADPPMNSLNLVPYDLAPGHVWQLFVDADKERSLPRCFQ
jgi:hypothetical protein